MAKDFRSEKYKVTATIVPNNGKCDVVILDDENKEPIIQGGFDNAEKAENFIKTHIV